MSANMAIVVLKHEMPIMCWSWHALRPKEGKQRHISSDLISQILHFMRISFMNSG